MFRVSFAVLGGFLGGLMLLPLSSLAQVCGEDGVRLPSAPKTGRTEGHRQQLITRGENDCPSVSQPLTALTSSKASDYTFSAYPSFWFFVPFSKDQVAKLEFLLYDESETNLIYKTEVEVPSQAGLIEIAIPQQARYALKENQQYRWYFFLDCQNSSQEQPDLEVNGWITRRPLTATISQKIHSDQPIAVYSAYQEYGAWYDAVAVLGSSLRYHPNDFATRTIWNHLLACLELDWVTQAQFVDEPSDLPSARQVLFEWE